MKLDKIRFARLISFISHAVGELQREDIEEIDCIIDVDVPETSKASCEAVDELLKQIALNERIPAIKAYRNLTGAGLKESKDAVEKYWLRQPAIVAPADANLGEILAQGKIERS